MTALAHDPLDVVRGRGRPSNADLTRSLERARLVNISLREQLRAEQLEGRELAERVRREALRIAHEVTVGDLVEAHRVAMTLGAAGDRFLRQRSSGVL